MATPQLENGYTRISNELLEKILEYPFKSYEMKVVMKIIRDTYGWKTKKKLISYAQIAKAIKKTRRSVIKTCKSLSDRKIIFKQKLRNKKNLWGINKKYSEWLLPDGSLFVEQDIEEGIKEMPDWEKMWIEEKFPAITNVLEKEIDRIIKQYGEENFMKAIRIAVRQNTRKITYIEGILKKMCEDNTHRTQISDGRWLTDEELAEAELKGEIYYDRRTKKWIAVAKSV